MHLRGQRKPALGEGCPGSETFGTFSVTFSNKRCNYVNVWDKIDAKKTPACTSSGDKIMIDLLGPSVTTVAEANETVRQLCVAAYDSFDHTKFAFANITQKGTEFDNEFYSGGTHWN